MPLESEVVPHIHPYGSIEFQAECFGIKIINHAALSFLPIEKQNATSSS